MSTISVTEYDPWLDMSPFMAAGMAVLTALALALAVFYGSVLAALLTPALSWCVHKTQNQFSDEFAVQIFAFAVEYSAARAAERDLTKMETGK